MGTFYWVGDERPLENRAPKVVSHFLSHSPERSADFAGALQSSLDMRQNVLAPDLFDEIGLLEQFRRLIARAAE